MRPSIVELGYIIEHYSYLGVFGVLLATGLGFPLPEEPTLILGGWLVHRTAGDFLSFVFMVLTCTAAILIGDSVPYALGRWLGDDLLRRRGLRRLLSPKRLAKAQRQVDRHGNKAILIARFLAGIRIPTFFVAGSLRMPYRRFIAYDFLGCLISVPVSVWLGWRFGEHVDRAIAMGKGVGHWILAGLVAIIAIVILVAWLRRRREPAVEPPAEESPAPEPAREAVG